MTRWSQSIPWVAFVILLAGCQDQASIVQPRSFDRPEDVTFACFDAAGGEIVPLSRCQRRIENTGRPLDEERDALRLLGIVTQTGRGEVAAVDLTEGLILDADARVPGFTFVRVSEAPVGIVVRPGSPELTYVASFGARRLEAVATADFDPRATGPMPAVPPPLPLPGAPTDLVLAPRGDALYMPLPAQSAIYRVPLTDDGAFVEDEAEMIPLPGPVEEEEPAPVDLSAMPRASVPVTAEAGRYERACQYDIPDPALVPPREPTAAGETPQPVALRFDPDPGVSGTVDPDAPVRLYVADEARPVVHVLHLEEGMDGLTHRHEAFNVQVPTQGLALTPPVPSVGLQGEGMCGPARYLYAIDATDGSVLTVDVSDDSSESYGAVLPVDTGTGETDRIDFGNARARTIEVLTPDYPGVDMPCGAGSCETGMDETNAPGPSQLRGVFLAAGLADGTLRFADIVDLDSPCRISPDDCEEAGETGVFIQRHRPRLATTERTVVELGGPPTFAFDGIPNNVLSSGNVEAGEAPGIANLEDNACPGGMLEVFGTDEPEPGEVGGPLICATADPWTSRPQTWQARWQGVIPGTQGSRGRFGAVADREFLASGAAFCARGVLGSEFKNRDALGENDPERGYTGDALVITSPLPKGKELEDELCERFRVEEDEELPNIAFAIRRAQMEDGTGRLVLGGALGDFGLEAVRRCYDELVGYEIRLRDAYRVAGSSSGFLHRVVAAEDDGRCIVDLSESDRLNGRAFPAQQYRNPLVSFEIRAFDEEDADDDGEPDMLGLPEGTTATLEFALTRVPAPLIADLCSPNSSSRCITSLPTTMRFNDVDQRLYIVDMAERGLMTLDTDPLQILQTFE